MSKLKSTRGDLSSSTLSQNKKTPKERLPYGHSLSRMFRLQRYKKSVKLQMFHGLFSVCDTFINTFACTGPSEVIHGVPFLVHLDVAVVAQQFHVAEVAHQVGALAHGDDVVDLGITV